jgi:hypothetical protein
MHTPAHRPIARLAALLVTAGLAACSETNATAAVSKDEYLAAANTICVELNQERERVVAESFSALDRPPTVAELQAFAGTFAPIFRSKLDAMREIEAPAGDERTVDAIYDAGERVAAGIEQLATDPTLATRMIETDEDVPGAADADRLASEYGLTKCADGSTE